jgi:hypothetical protein
VDRRGKLTVGLYGGAPTRTAPTADGIHRPEKFADEMFALLTVGHFGALQNCRMGRRLPRKSHCNMSLSPDSPELRHAPGIVLGPWTHGDRIVVGFQYDVTNKPSRKRMKMDEVGLYTVRNGKIVREEFFYDAEM